MIFTSSIWPAPAKINLFLYINSRRTNGYHNLQTIFQFLEYGDQLMITPRIDGQINLLTPIIGIPNNENLIIRAAKLLRDQLPNYFSYHGADLLLKKNIPIGSGLGGGSSDAATILVALNKLWQANLSHDVLIKLGALLGADVPFFINGHAYFSEGVGRLKYPVYPVERWYLIVNPNINISTALIFRDPDLKRDSPVRSLRELLRIPYSNDCEITVRRLFRKVDKVILWLSQYATSRLTGTGACVFAEFDTKKSAQQVLKQAPIGIKAFVARGINVSPLQIFSQKYFYK
ncbi:4-(cytidine 5'-diphospho)-2-C-methyl-D-erythritol kinase [Candidatus Profftia sp. (ex Adelges kitamiensis)]|uniref:4-(cytidine 5'-diphospho)-2-C-methyl-D-erythritol kinase n=1 Tax=Candidatus Profftia sp. (ex Adelges kitamiensis) TaxID=2864218 RepID=UPI001CE33F75|nr:4-(cytidine 5'-diphospho)-2-C-methyl-D-erythritol kinase [Candidatus Profftia sp. (ex Adelges kitamiensis)]